MEGYSIEVREQLERIANTDALLSLQGITRVLDIVNARPPQREVIDEFGYTQESDTYGVPFNGVQFDASL
jgi:hypothetical protein